MLAIKRVFFWEVVQRLGRRLLGPSTRVRISPSHPIFPVGRPAPQAAL